MPVKGYTSRNYNEKNTSEYALSIQLGLDGFCFIIKHGNKLLAFDEVRFEAVSKDQLFVKISEAYNNFPILLKTYKKVQILWQTSRYLLIPNDLFEATNAKNLFEVNYSLAPLDEIHFNVIDAVNAVLIFSINSEVIHFLSSKYPKLELKSTATALTENNSLIDKSTVLISQVYNKNLDICLVQNNKPLLVNNFTFDSDSDLVYHLLNVPKQLGLERGNVYYAFAGGIHKDSERHKLISKFSDNIKLLEPAALDLPYTISARQKTQYYTLFSS
jgi:hypothetical protein